MFLRIVIVVVCVQWNNIRWRTGRTGSASSCYLLSTQLATEELAQASSSCAMVLALSEELGAV